jgi:hypothetical protein
MPAKKTRKRKTTARKGHRSPAQRAATRKLVALNRKRAKAKRKGRKTTTRQRKSTTSRRKRRSR